MSAASTTRLAERGFTLLEALITIVIISIGLLGILGLQTVSIANTQISAARSQATIAADNIADRMRANSAAAADGFYETSDPGDSNANDNPQPSDTCGDSKCTPQEMATFDLWEWKQSLDRDEGTRLPNGRGFLSCASGTDCRRYIVTVVWSERDREAERSGNTPDQCPDRADITDRCFETVVQP